MDKYSQMSVNIEIKCASQDKPGHLLLAGEVQSQVCSNDGVLHVVQELLVLICWQLTQYVMAILLQ